MPQPLPVRTYLHNLQINNIHSRDTDAVNMTGIHDQLLSAEKAVEYFRLHGVMLVMDSADRENELKNNLSIFVKSFKFERVYLSLLFYHQSKFL